MKKLLIPLVAIFALATTANAQDKMGKKGQQRHHQKGMMAKELNLSDAQKAQAKTINADYRKKMQDLNKQDNITVKEMRNRKTAIQKDRKTKMDGLLTADQKNKIAKAKADRKVKSEDRSVKRMDKMKTNLNLSDEQVSKLKSQRSATQAKAEKIKNNESLSREQKKEQMMVLKAEAKEQHDKVLTPEQLKKKEEMRKSHADRSRAKK